MKNYGAMRFVAGVLSFIGWVIILFGAATFLLSIFASGNVPTTEYSSPAMVLVAGLAIGGFIILSGIFSIAGGQMIAAQADIATNSAYLRAIAANISGATSKSEKPIRL